MKNLENNEMIEISKTDLAALLECAYILKEVAKSRDVEDLYNIIEDGSIDSESFDETGEYTDSEIEDLIKTRYNLKNPLKKSLKKLNDIRHSLS